jgi:hypothetical protein
VGIGDRRQLADSSGAAHGGRSRNAPSPKRSPPHSSPSPAPMRAEPTRRANGERTRTKRRALLLLPRRPHFFSAGAEVEVAGSLGASIQQAPSGLELDAGELP